MTRWRRGACWSLVAVVGAGGPPELNIRASHHAPVTLPVTAPRTAAPRAAGRLVTTTFWSQALGARKQVVTWLPPSYDQSPATRYPVAIYLHGLWGEETDWSRRGNIAQALDALAAAGTELIVVMPDGDDSWYTTWNWLGDYAACRRDFAPREGRGDTVDSYCVPWPHYDDYIARDLVAFVDRTWRTDARRERRALAGLSMGGYGAVSIGMAYPDVFGAVVSHSGVLSPLYGGPADVGTAPRYAASVAELKAGWGERMWPLIAPAFGQDTTAWWARDPARRVRNAWQRRRTLVPALYVDIGTDDGLLGQNRAFRHELQALGVPFTYREWPGKHDWAYWTAHVPESLQWIGQQTQGKRQGSSRGP